ncbi:MAG: hypothetical protein LBP62_04195 [Clostridiales bacterium]|jgi:membrane associated rhomboid family serine protease|nr:hypothetical protein [Clostridiales bacterium]
MPLFEIDDSGTAKELLIRQYELVLKIWRVAIPLSTLFLIVLSVFLNLFFPGDMGMLRLICFAPAFIGCAAAALYFVLYKKIKIKIEELKKEIKNVSNE